MPKTFWEILKTVISVLAGFYDIKISSVLYETPVRMLLHSRINIKETKGHVFRTVAILTQPLPALPLHQFPKWL